jgi:hypothetical protein
MPYLEFLASSSCFWLGYFVVSGVLASLTGLLWTARSSAGWAERAHDVVWNGAIFFLGCALVFIDVQLLVAIFRTSSKTAEVVLGVLALVFFFYAIFCLSGRGIQLFSRMLTDGIAKIRIGWKGIDIVFRTERRTL